MSGRKSRYDNNLPKSKITFDSLKRALQLVNMMGKHKRLFLLGNVFLFITSITAIAFPKLIGMLIDAGKVSYEKINQVGLLFIALFLIQALASYLRIWTFVKSTETMVYNLRTSLYSKVITMPVNYFNNNRSGEIISRFSSDITQIQDTYTTFIATFLRQILIILAGITMLFVTSYKLALLMLSVIPLVVIVSLFFGRYIRKISRQVQDFTAESNTIVEETINGIQNVKAFVNESFEYLRFGNKAQEVRNLTVYRGILRGIFSSFIILCLFGAIVLLIWRAVQMERAGEIASGGLVQFMMYTVFVGGSIGGIAEEYAQIQKSIGSVDRILDILDSESEPLDTSGSKTSDLKIKGDIRFENISFYYPSRPENHVLSEVNFHVESGKKIALVGHSGSGKSTTAALLLRFYEPQNGTIFIDNKPSNAYSLFDLRSQMALVPQDVMLFGGSIYENILYGNPSAGREQVEEAARMANAYDFIQSFPERFDTLVGDRGIKLSGGQRQRIAIARAVLKNPAILILDEATSSLDSESELLVQEALEKLMKNRTSVVIAHRLSTIKDADLIVVLEKGKVVETGTHSELVKKESGKYKKMYELQFEE